jgi:Mg-chelatase subunit ChlD
MKGLTFKLGTAVATFLIGVALASGWLFLSRTSDSISPVNVVNNTNQPTLEMVFVLDTTSSMTGLIDGAKQRIWEIVNDVMQTSSHPVVRIGLVAYRDRDDAYVTKVMPLTNDLDLVYSTLMDYRAEGGGDGPENVRRALADGVQRAGWSASSPQVAQIIFLVGDAPPHDDYRDEPDTAVTTAKAVQKGMIINTIQCGQMAGTREIWQRIAQIGQGQYFAIAQDGGVHAISTPYDEQLGQLANQLGGTYVAYGGGGGAEGEARRAISAQEMATTEAKIEKEAAPTAKAERAMNKVLNSYAYVGDLMQDIENGSVRLESVKVEDLPADLRSLSTEERKQEIDKRLAERRNLRAQIMDLSKQRSEYIAAERKKQTGNKQSGFDAAVAAALTEQLAQKGIR